MGRQYRVETVRYSRSMNLSKIDRHYGPTGDQSYFIESKRHEEKWKGSRQTGSGGHHGPQNSRSIYFDREALLENH